MNTGWRLEYSMQYERTIGQGIGHDVNRVSNSRIKMLPMKLGRKLFGDLLQLVAVSTQPRRLAHTGAMRLYVK